jgi:hypothetical protein
MHHVKPKTVEDFVGRYPRILETIALAAQLPSLEHAAIILRDAVERRKSYSEWVLMRYGGDAVRAVRSAIKSGTSFRTLHRINTSRSL